MNDKKPLEDDISKDEAPDEDIAELMENHDLDQGTAEQVREAMDEYGVDEDDAVELIEEGL